MLSTDEQKKICAEYSKPGPDGLVRCTVCPLCISVYWMMCHANSHYDAYECDFVLHNKGREISLRYPEEPFIAEDISWKQVTPKTCRTSSLALSAARLASSEKTLCGTARMDIMGAMKSM